jgi:hypothetical protein
VREAGFFGVVAKRFGRRGAEANPFIATAPMNLAERQFFDSYVMLTMENMAPSPSNSPGADAWWLSKIQCNKNDSQKI